MKRKKEHCNNVAKLINVRYDYVGGNHTPLQRNGMTAIPKENQNDVSDVDYLEDVDQHLLTAWTSRVTGTTKDLNGPKMLDLKTG